MTDESPSGRSSPDPDVWYHAAAGEPEGPLSRGELLRLLARGAVPRSAPVWRSGMEDWKPARQVPELAELLPPPMEEDRTARAPEPERPGGSWSLRFDLPVWGPVAGALLLVLVAGGFAWILSSDGTGIGLASGAPAGPNGRSDPGDGDGRSLTADQRVVARTHRAALEDSLERLAGGDTLVATLEEGGLAWTRRVGFQGLDRLPDRPLVDHAELMGKALREAPDDLCSAVAEWGATSQGYWRLLAGLSPPEMARLLEVLRGGVMAELRDRTAWPAPDPEAVSAAFSMLGERLDGASRDSLRRVLARDAAPSPSEACWAERTLYGGVPRMPDPWRAVLARAAVTG